ncbi:hypothetical protein FOXYSP1_12801 [Fusarium oxysporum f. sp. phaseoli]
MRASHQGKHGDIHDISRCERADNVTKQSVVNARIFMSDMIIWRGASASFEQLRETSSPTAKTTYRDTSHASQECSKPLSLIVYSNYARYAPLYAYIKTCHQDKLQS